MKTPAQTISGIKETLKKNSKIKPPEWAAYIKTGVCAYRPPQQEDWWYIRAAAVLRQVYLHGPVGVSRLRTVYGARKRRGHKPPHAMKAGGKIIRLMLQQLEQSDLIKQVDKPKKGRIVTSKGQSLVDRHVR
ncbi:MAG: 30S ribosomal protein S19e [Nanoarchaeota archaeon]|nr:30S ribosomal protein S19e [Nanoarchaeota archaeon]MBU4124216.1 30S ribosomal protein S19e [Nanoarchaeota archaeon]